jgi:hypothetical protein
MGSGTRGYLRVIFLALLSLALIGPWMFDRINVPAEYTCYPPNVRLYGDFCGVPLSGIQLLYLFFSGLIFASKGLVGGSVGFTDWLRQIAFSLPGFLILLPIFSTLNIVMSRAQLGQQIFNLVAWVFALGVCLVISLSGYPRLFWALWGVWLYIGLAAGQVILGIMDLSLRAET